MCLLSPQLHTRSQCSVNALHTAWPSLPSDSATWPEKGVSLSLFPRLKVGVIPSLTRIKRDNTKDLDEVHSPNRPRVVVLWFYLSSCITASEAKYLPNLLGPQTVRKQKRYSVFKTWGHRCDSAWHSVRPAVQWLNKCWPEGLLTLSQRFFSPTNRGNQRGSRERLLKVSEPLFTYL